MGKGYSKWKIGWNEEKKLMEDVGVGKAAHKPPEQKAQEN